MVFNPCNRPQYAENWGFLQHSSLPSNVDGISCHITERRGNFLFQEVKRGEPLPTGQNILLEGLARLPQFVVLVVRSEMVPPDDKNCREVVPRFYNYYYNDNGVILLSSPIKTNPEHFRNLYHRWFKELTLDVWKNGHQQ